MAIWWEGVGNFHPIIRPPAINRGFFYRPAYFFNFDSENLIAVRIYDQEIAGGIVRGDLGIFSRHEAPVPEVDLSGRWRFTTGDDPSWARLDFDDSAWSSIVVPGFWLGGCPKDALAVKLRFRVVRVFLTILIKRLDKMIKLWYFNIVATNESAAGRGNREQKSCALAYQIVVTLGLENSRMQPMGKLAGKRSIRSIKKGKTCHARMVLSGIH